MFFILFLLLSIDNTMDKTNYEDFNSLCGDIDRATWILDNTNTSVLIHKYKCAHNKQGPNLQGNGVDTVHYLHTPVQKTCNGIFPYNT